MTTNDQWYYVVKGNRQGPVDLAQLRGLIKSGTVTLDDSVWTKKFDRQWMKVREVDELKDSNVLPKSYAQLADLPQEERLLYIRIGRDRGQGAMTEYGPFSMDQLKKLKEENRINGKTEIYFKDMQEWKFLADFLDYEIYFGEVPPPIENSDRRTFIRRPFIARLFIQNQKGVYEGICRDVSIGGMQILIDDFPGLPNDRISINVHPDNTDYHFVASGTIVRKIDGGSGFSFRFDQLSDEAKLAIEKYINDTDSNS